MPALKSLALLALATLVVAPVALAQDAPERRRNAPNLITAEEIAERAPTAQSAQEIIERLRPQWLRPGRGTQRASGELYTRPQLQVYLDGTRQQGVEVLRTVLREFVKELRFMSGIDATARYGLDHEMGAVLITTSGKD
jgi:hypothetical protein